MTPPIRLRQHADGRLAVFRDGMWLITSVPPDCLRPSWFHDDRLCSGPGWSELLVAELPEPDDEGSDGRPVWITDSGVTFVPYVGVVSVDEPGAEEIRELDAYDIGVLKSNALKILAAVAACEQYRAQREATT